MTVWPAYGDGAMLDSLLMVEASSETEREDGEPASEGTDPKETILSQRSQNFRPVCCVSATSADFILADLQKVHLIQEVYDVCFQISTVFSS